MTRDLLGFNNSAGRACLRLQKNVYMITARAIALLLLFAVTAGAQANQPPVLNPIGPKSTTENV